MKETLSLRYWIGVLISCATPAARRPMDSSRSLEAMRSSAALRSVMSMMMPSISTAILLVADGGVPILDPTIGAVARAQAKLERQRWLAPSSLARTAHLRADMRYQSTSKVKFSPQKPIDEYDSRLEVDARATYAFGENERHEVSLFGKNLTSEKYCVEIQDLRGVSGSFYCVPNEGEAQYGLQAKFRF